MLEFLEQGIETRPSGSGEEYIGHTFKVCSENPSQSFMLDSREHEQVAIKKEIRT